MMYTTSSLFCIVEHFIETELVPSLHLLTSSSPHLLRWLFEQVLEEVLCVGGTGADIVGVSQLLHHLLFVFAQVLWDIDADVDEQIACAVGASVLVDFRQTFATQTQYFAGLRTRVNLHFHFARQCRNFHLCPQGGGWNGKQHVVYQIAAIAYEVGMRRFFYQHVQIAVHSVVRGGIAFAGYGELHTVHYAGRNIDADDIIGTLYAFAIAMRTFVLDNLAFAVTFGACFLCLHHT